MYLEKGYDKIMVRKCKASFQSDPEEGSLLYTCEQVLRSRIRLGEGVELFLSRREDLTRESCSSDSLLCICFSRCVDLHSLIPSLTREFFPNGSQALVVITNH